MNPTFEPHGSLLSSLPCALVLLLALGLAVRAAEVSPAANLNVLVVTGGHGFDREPFFRMFVDNPGIQFMEAKHTKDADAYERADLFTYDVVVLYDMPKAISDTQKARFLSLFDKGAGLVVLHHALVSYPKWPEYERIIGGRYPEPDPNKPGTITEQVGYEHDVDIPIVIVAKEHPVTAGLKDFTIHDETYWGFRVGRDVTPLLTTTHPKSGKPLAWTRTEKKSRIVFMQSGHGPAAFSNPNYRALLAQSIRWVAGESPRAAMDLKQWRYSKRLTLDTSASGANVAGDVANFPVAVALSAANFDFNQAKDDGSDLRFSAEPNLHGSGLPHSIEHWVRSNQTALVWVKIPKVHGNSADQAVYLHWGNPGAVDASDSHAVFDTRDGFVGAWNLGDEGSMDADGYKDSTANAAHGMGINLGRSSRVQARVGRGVVLRHAAAQWIRVGSEKRKLFDLTTNVTFSIWAKAHGYENKGDPARRALAGYETMFAKGDNSWRLQKFGIRSWHKPPAELIEICVEQPPRADLCVVGKTDMATNQWYHLVGVHEHPKVRLYVNGVLDKEETFNVPWTSGDHAVGIGNQSQFPDQGRSWDGVLDEARVLYAAKDEHWIKLDYESQREGQRFLTFGESEQRF